MSVLCQVSVKYKSTLDKYLGMREEIIRMLSSCTAIYIYSVRRGKE